MLAYIAIAIAGLAVMLLLSHHVELRPGRYSKIALSIPLLLAETAIVRLPREDMRPLIIPAVVILMLLILIWRSNAAFLIACAIMGALNGSTTKLTGFAPDYSYVRRAVKRRDFSGALELIEPEIDKDPAHYEGVCLLFQSLHAMGKLGDAAAVLEFAVEQEYLPAQTELLRRELQDVRAALLLSRADAEPVLLKKSKVFKRMLTPKAAKAG